MAEIPGSVAVVYGTRPEIIKLGPLIRLLGDSARLINTGQHFDHSLSGGIADEFGLANPFATLAVGGVSRASQIAGALQGLEGPLAGSEAVVVQGDTNSALAGALGANSMDIPLFHVEAGLRSWDRRMPEEHNRVLIDHLADMCWAPTSVNVANLNDEGISSERVEQTGNPIVESLTGIAPTGDQIEDILDQFGLGHKQYVLVTMHRPENVDAPSRLGEILDGLARIGSPVVFPMHPRTAATVDSAGLGHMLDALVVVPPVGYQTFLGLLAGSRFAVSDSGGVQEEVSILKIPLIVVRRSTERPEVLDTFAQITDDVSTMVSWGSQLTDEWEDRAEQLRRIDSPFGDGLASERMVTSLRRFLG